MDDDSALDSPGYPDRWASTSADPDLSLSPTTSSGRSCAAGEVLPAVDVAAVGSRSRLRCLEVRKKRRWIIDADDRKRIGKSRRSRRVKYRVRRYIYREGGETPVVRTVPSRALSYRDEPAAFFDSLLSFSLSYLPPAMQFSCLEPFRLSLLGSLESEFATGL